MPRNTQALWELNFQARAETLGDWQRIPPLTASGGGIEGVRLALEHGADPRKGLNRCRSLTAVGSKIACEKAESACHWPKRSTDQRDDNRRTVIVVLLCMHRC